MCHTAPFAQRRNSGAALWKRSDSSGPRMNGIEVIPGSSQIMQASTGSTCKTRTKKK
jgi:hypothetical protein